MLKLAIGFVLGRWLVCFVWWYVLWHKWYVFIECCRLGIPWLGVIHDWSKLVPEIGADMDTLLSALARSTKQALDRTPVCLPMPDRYRREMLADWHGAGRAITGEQNTRDWYLQNRENIMLHDETRQWIEKELGIQGVTG